MDTIRMIAIALPMTLLLACGGGGGGGTASVAPTAAPPTTTPPTTGDPNTPPTTGDPNTPPTTGDPNTPPTTTPDPMTPPTVTLPGYAVNAATARTNAGGTAPTSMTETQIVSAIQTRATAADTFEFSDFVGTPDVSITCPDNSKSCSGTVPNVGVVTFSLADIGDLSLVDGDMGLMDFDSDTEAVMVDNGVTMIQSQSVARDSDGTQLTFQTYGGWLADSVFGVELLDVTENDTTTSRVASFSFGDDTGSRPTGSGLGRWTGSMVGMNTDKNVFQGDASIEIDFDDTRGARITGIAFESIVNIDTGASAERMSWIQIPVGTDGTFSSTTGGDIDGAFYGDGHAAVGGTFNRNNIIGAFGAAKQ